jgi:hypothetical protein
MPNNVQPGKENQNADALISMMARSTTRSNQRPNTLMQHRKADRSLKRLAITAGPLKCCQIRPLCSVSGDGGLPLDTFHGRRGLVRQES